MSAQVVQGSFDGFTGMVAGGWAWMPGDAGRKVVVQLLIDGALHEERPASEFRQDLKDANIGDGNCGVRFVLPERLLDKALHRIELRAKETGAMLNSSPRTFCNALFAHRDMFAADGPMLDLDTGAETIARRLNAGEIAPDLAQRLVKWREDGYVIFERAIDRRLLAKCNSDIDAAVRDRTHVQVQTRLGMQSLRDLERPIDWHTVRILEFHSVSEAAAQIILDPVLVSFLKEILDGTPVVMQTLLFMYGSTQRAHMDFPYVHTPKPAYLAASWCALEDVRPEAGPLFLFPKSHRLVPKFDFGGGNLLAFEDGWHIRHFESYLEQAARGLNLEYKLFMANAGDVLFWHSALVHGGSPRTSPDATRRSLVAHYSPDHVYREDRRYAGKRPNARPRNGGVYYDYQASGDPELTYRL